MNGLDQQLHLNDYGTTFDIELRDGDTVLNPSIFTSGSHVFRRPDLTTLTKASAATVTSSGSYMRYTTVSGDVNQVGSWAVQCVVTDGVGYFSSDIWQFVVYPNLT